MPTESIGRSGLECLARAVFDSEFYFTMYPDVRNAQLDAFDHYMSHGWREKRFASATFDTGYYVEAYPDVLASNVNPLLHYVSAGIFEGRTALRPPPGNPGKSIVLNAVSVREQVTRARAAGLTEESLTFDQLHCRINAEFENKNGGIAISLSHDQYLLCVGGVQNVVAAEAAALMNSGWTYIHLCPAQALPMLADEGDPQDTYLMLTISGQRQGVVRLADFFRVMAIHEDQSARTFLVIHHLMGFAMNDVLNLSRFCRGSSPFVWVHDFFTLCVNPFLLRNDYAFCGAPASGSNSCAICNNGQVRHRHLDAMKRLFDELRPVVLFPSAAALEFWYARGGYSVESSKIIAPAQIDFGSSASGVNHCPLRIAHLGAPASHKGWATFEKLVMHYSNDERYQFFRLGAGFVGTHGLKEIKVQVTPDNPDAMVHAVREYEIDVVVNWSNCFETFSFTTLEAIAGGAFVVARRDAGNVWPAVAAAGPDRGIAVRTEMELRALLCSGKILTYARASRKYGQLQRAHGAASLLREKLHEARHA